jgi:hypothetical protein
MTVITMSRTEIDRMSVLQDLADGRIKIADASTLMGLGRRQVASRDKLNRAERLRGFSSLRRTARTNCKWLDSFFRHSAITRWAVCIEA